MGQKKILLFVTWVDHECIMLKEISQPDKDNLLSVLPYL